ncbi:CRISPR-associated helicase Cas3' [Thermopolyspora flexuosa]|uniref:CRISPR-associated endonuclease/helicase Cas3 n=1 Tax=Thermopolyspora flexuosa TaxID=103836 RepID=A0A543IYU3_9ACTN|nr:CRISPR-associated helicase Cas3' [Thermopolyspora flexuosa]TQM75744.1 CRISPR-associated endonuclease/helicase Cas3 [Thermopolyspora flexuosa]
MEGGSGQGLSNGLSRAARAVWAKHDRDSEGWLPLWRHMADSGAVAGLLWDGWLPAQVRRLVEQALPAGAEDARRLAVWAAMTHDIGKATPAFACQVDSLAETMRAAGLGMPFYKEFPDRRLAPHGLAGMLLLREWLIERHGWAKPAALQLAIVAGGHHGVPPTHLDIQQVTRRPELLRSPECAQSWRDVQWELLDWCAEECGVQKRLPHWRSVKLPQQAQVLLTGLVIVADWIASNSDLFPYFPDAQKVGEHERVSAAWRALDLPKPWRAIPPSIEDIFSARFSLPSGAQPRPVQRRAVEIAQAMSRPGLLLIEAPMGEGKTEAALAVTEVFAARSEAGGCYVALPTMATGNAMFPRLLSWLGRMFEGREGRQAVHLAHSKAALNEQYVELVRAGRRAVRGVEIDGAPSEWRPRADRRAASTELIAHQWLRGRKKAMLAEFGVGTIDQLLFMGLKSRHLALRHLALAGKVVVIDEAHAYDTYMNAYLDRVLSWLGAYGVPVVVLSATLPARRRRELAEAYSGATTLAEIESASGYPLITAVERDRPPVIEAVPGSGRDIDVHLERLDDDLPTLTERLRRELADGGCALVIRNTVDRVLETADHLRGSFENVLVAHSRFLDLDRLNKDATLLRLFGPPGTAKQRPTAPYIVVASQVAEQSLDIDFDLLVSDLCPIDLLLQRMGRLHRHQRGEGQSERPERLRTARCLVTGADWAASPVEPVAGSRRVYGLYPLLRAAAVLEPYLSGTAPTGNVVRLPHDISPLVQRAYGPEPVGPEQWQDALARAREAHELQRSKQHQKAQDFQINPVGKPGSALIGWLDAGVGDADDTRKGRAQVRDTPESLEVLVVQRRADGALITVPWLSDGRGGLELPTESVPEPRLARIVAACGLRLPYQFSDPETLDRAIQELETQCIPAWQSEDSHWLAGELILVLDENCRTRLAGYDLHYSEADGLRVAHAE